MKRGKYYTGTSGLLLPVPNKEHYPEEFKNSSRLTYYGSLFNSIEINSSFYKMPMERTTAKWASEVPDDFQYTFKLFRDITHSKELVFDDQLVGHFLDRINGVGFKKGCLLIQFPGSIKISQFQKVSRLLSHVLSADESRLWKIAVEFRDVSWYTEETMEWLNAEGIASVIHDKLPAGGPTMNVGSDFVYVRFHGPDGNYLGSYSSDFLQEYAYYIEEWLSEGKDVYCYFNNTMGRAIENLNELGNLVNEIRG